MLRLVLQPSQTVILFLITPFVVVGHSLGADGVTGVSFPLPFTGLSIYYRNYVCDEVVWLSYDSAFLRRCLLSSGMGLAPH